MRRKSTAGTSAILMVFLSFVACSSLISCKSKQTPLVAASKAPQSPLAGSAIPQFQDPLPLLGNQALGLGGTMWTELGNKNMTIRMCEFKAAVLPSNAVAGYTGTWVWGYLVDPTGQSTCADLVSLYGNSAGILDTYIGPVLVNNRNGGSTTINWVNNLGNTATTNVLAYKNSTDQTIHWADPLADQTMANMCMMLVDTCGFTSPSGQPQCFPNPGDPCAQNYRGPIAAVPHLHGGEQPAEVDGGPEQWFTSNGAHKGNKYYSFAGADPNAAIFKYPNTQQAAPLWFHDHTLGATRLNVYAGLAGAYFIQDPAVLPLASGGTCTTNCLPANLQPLTEVVPLVLQDRMFDKKGQLFFPADSAGGELSSLNPQHPYWVPEFVGDAIVINGKAWPYMNVQPKRYRFLFLNGSNARTYEMYLMNASTSSMGPKMWVIGTDGGYLDAPAAIDPNAAAPAQSKLLIMPGERYEVIIDFSQYAGQTLVLANTGNTPYPDGASPQVDQPQLGQLMQFRVSAPAVADASYDPAGGTPLRTGSYQIARLVNTAAGAIAAGVTIARTRELTLNEVALAPSHAIDPVTGVPTDFPGGPVEILVNNTHWEGTAAGAQSRTDFTPVTVNGSTLYLSERPIEGETEIWEIVNTTGDAHPIHLHLVQFQLINRQDYNTDGFEAAYQAAFGQGPVSLPAACTSGVYCPGYGPPLDYDASLNAQSGGKFGGNPDVTPYLTGSAIPPNPHEAGWKDTMVMRPGQVTRIAVRWAPNDLPVNTPAAQQFFPFDPSGEDKYNYVWHCHIIDHEDNEMMRPDMVQVNPAAPAPASRSLVKGVNY